MVPHGHSASRSRSSDGSVDGNGTHHIMDGGVHDPGALDIIPFLQCIKSCFGSWWILEVWHLRSSAEIRFPSPSTRRRFPNSASILTTHSPPYIVGELHGLVVSIIFSLSFGFSPYAGFTFITSIIQVEEASRSAGRSRRLGLRAIDGVLYGLAWQPHHSWVS
ncbi:hypothetical protein BKA80DRAFT_58454 [Phyllosticta citrichinensis]